MQCLISERDMLLYVRFAVVFEGGNVTHYSVDVFLSRIVKKIKKLENNGKLSMPS